MLFKALKNIGFSLGLMFGCDFQWKSRPFFINKIQLEYSNKANNIEFNYLKKFYLLNTPSVMLSA
jgi:hypothetical protein